MSILEQLTNVLKFSGFTPENDANFMAAPHNKKYANWYDDEIEVLIIGLQRGYIDIVFDRNGNLTNIGASIRFDKEFQQKAMKEFQNGNSLSTKEWTDQIKNKMNEDYVKDLPHTD